MLLSAFVDGNIEHTDDWLQGMVDSFYPRPSAVIIRDGEKVTLELKTEEGSLNPVQDVMTKENRDLVRE